MVKKIAIICVIIVTLYFSIMLILKNVFYPKKYKELIPIFEKLPFKEKKDVLAELFLILEHDELLPNSIDGYEIARRLIKY